MIFTVAFFNVNEVLKIIQDLLFISIVPFFIFMNADIQSSEICYKIHNSKRHMLQFLFDRRISI